MTRAVALALMLGAMPALAQPYDPRLPFHSLETPHFVVHFHDGEETLAQEVARDAERAHGLLAPLVGNEDPQRTQIMLVDTDDAANGFATPVPYNTIQLLAAAPDVRSELNTFEDWVWQLVVHEYTHILHLDTISGPAAIVNVALGKQLSPNAAWPRWFTEGWAVLEESANSRGGRLRSSMHDMQLRMHVLENKPLSLSTLSSPPLQWPRRSAWYLYGGRFLQFIAEKHGATALSGMSHDNAGTVIPYFLGTIAERQTGEDFGALYEAWQAALRERYAAQAKAVGDGSPERRLTTGGESRRSPRFSADSRTLYTVRRDADRKPVLLAFDLVTGTERTIRELNDEGVFAVAPDGTLVIEQTDVFRNFESYEDLFTLDPKTAAFEPISRGARLSEPDVAADGRIVAVQRPGAGRTAIVLFESLAAARDGHGRVLAEGEGFHPVASPRFSPDGTKVVYSLHRRTSYDLQLLDLATGEQRDLTNDGAQDLTPAFSEDGRRVLFSSDRTGIFDVYELDLETRDVTRRTRVLGGAFEPVERGGKLYYLRYGAGGYDLAAQDEPFREAAPQAPGIPQDSVPPRSEETLRYPAHAYAASDTLRPTYWLPIIGADPTGTTLGASLGGADVLQKYGWSASLFWSLGGNEPGFSATVRTDALWPSLSLSGSRSLDSVAGAPDGYVERQTGARGTASWMFRRQYSSTRLDLGWQFTQLSAAKMGDLTPTGPVPPAQGHLSTPIFSVVHSSALRFENAISAEEGRRLSLDVRGSAPWTGSDFRTASVSGSWAEYFRLPPWSGTSHHVLALRGAGGLGAGDLGGRQLFGLGGPSVLNIVGDLVALQSPTRLLRGYRANAASGRAFVLGSAEYRFPLAVTELGAGTLPVALRRIHGALFVDAGDAFQPENGPKLRYGVGGELRFELVLGYRLLTDVRVGYARGLSRGGQDQLLVLFGSGF